LGFLNSYNEFSSFLSNIERVAIFLNFFNLFFFLNSQISGI
jgi:hypothetical protein